MEKNQTTWTYYGKESETQWDRIGVLKKPHRSEEERKWKEIRY